LGGELRVRNSYPGTIVEIVIPSVAIAPQPVFAATRVLA
jgi:hypothetical protein